ncbi:hypothetical protein [Methylobacterium sp. E-045]|uniref:hypothetical protein n=1 Tax=Methylobacterium sp. E-045 TaxID=2836575 RepID=UPI001FB8652B|nr:hypothetical protein [Methylobacterium sp. E-045]MCJ2129226.1 hypothetical protein [Methylobacterium sp. E-045]
MIKSLGAVPQSVLPFLPTIVPLTPGDWAVTYATQTGVMITDGLMADIEITLTFTPTFTTAATGALRILGHPIPFASAAADINVTNHTANITYPSSGTYLVGRITSDLSAINLAGLKTAGTPGLVMPAQLVSGAVHRVDLAGRIRIGAA